METLRPMPAPGSVGQFQDRPKIFRGGAQVCDSLETFNGIDVLGPFRIRWPREGREGGQKGKKKGGREGGLIVFGGI
jgi:hypothetical protein